MIELTDLKFNIIHNDQFFNRIISEFERVSEKINNIQDTRFNDNFSQVITTLKKVMKHIAQLKSMFASKRRGDKLLKVIAKKLTKLANDLDYSFSEEGSYRGINMEEKQQFSRLINLLHEITNQENEYSEICNDISKKIQKISILLKEDIITLKTLRDYCLRNENTNELFDALEYMLDIPTMQHTEVNTVSITPNTVPIATTVVASACTENPYNDDEKCIADLITNECLEDDVIVNKNRKTKQQFGECYNKRTYEKLNRIDPFTRKVFEPLQLNVRQILARRLLSYTTE
tara:strand:+ start:3436 stop:4302 length:867 start_codon:yes stop_codon:yes gene_type:complete